MSKKFKEATKLFPNYGKITASRYKGVKGKSWKLLSDYTRMRDFINYQACISCEKTILDWTETDAGHYISMGGHGAASGFNHLNIHLQCKYCNMNASQHTGAKYEDNLYNRGVDVAGLHKVAQALVKADDWFFLAMMEDTYERFQELAKNNPNYDFPDYLVV